MHRGAFARGLIISSFRVLSWCFISSLSRCDFWLAGTGFVSVVIGWRRDAFIPFYYCWWLPFLSIVLAFCVNTIAKRFCEQRYYTRPRLRFFGLFIPVVFLFVAKGNCFFFKPLGKTKISDELFRLTIKQLRG